MSTTIYDKGFLQADAERRVASITVSASATTSTVTGQPNYFHWRFYLVLDPPASPAHSQSVVLDMMPTNPPKGCLIISSQPTWRSTAQLKIEFPIATVGSPKVGQIISLFKYKGMDRYVFDETCSGCLWWISVGVSYLEEAHLIEAGATENLRRFHKEQAALHPERHPLPLRKGTFYW